MACDLTLGDSASTQTGDVVIIVPSMRNCIIALAAAGMVSTGCLPYTVGSTARPVPPGAIVPTASLYFLPGAVESEEAELSLPVYGLDAEVRYGLDQYSDLGVRITALSGAVLTYKRRLNGLSADSGTAVALMGGGGVVNAGEHALLELTFLATARDRDTWTPYGGLRAMHVFPLSRYATRDQPTAGGFLGIRLGTTDLGISPEIGIYYDPSALGLRQRRVIFVPALSIHGSRLLAALGGLRRR